MPKGKEIVGLECDAPAAEGIKLILRTRLEEMCELKSAALNWSDIEGVHDMRVSSRRLRSALRDFKPSLKRRQHRRASDAIKGIADALGAVRDEDVAIAALEKLAASAPNEVGVGIELFAGERRSAREIDRAALVVALGDDLAGVRAEFEASLESAIGTLRNADKMDISFGALGRRIILLRTEELQQYSTSLYRPFTTKPLHRMRIAAKRLRYAIELVAPCGNTQFTAFAKEVAAMQTSLGELHDCDVWIAEFGRLLESTSVRDELVESTEAAAIENQERQAAAWLLGHFTKRRTSQYRNALARWCKWDTTDFFTRLETCMR